MIDKISRKRRRSIIILMLMKSMLRIEKMKKTIKQVNLVTIAQSLQKRILRNSKKVLDFQ